MGKLDLPSRSLILGSLDAHLWVVPWYQVWSLFFFYPFWGNFDLDLWPLPKVKVIVTWVIECALLGCTLVKSMKSVGEIASEIWPVLYFFTHFFENLTLTCDLYLRSRSSSIKLLNMWLWLASPCCRSKIHSLLSLFSNLIPEPL